MVSAAAASVARRNEAMVAALAKHLSALSLDPEKLSAKAVEEQDILSLFTSVLQLSSADACLQNKDEIMKWVIFANNLPSNAEDCHSALKGLNDVLSNKSVLVGDGLKTSEADVVVFTALQPVVGHLSQADKPNFPHLMRWMDYIQNTEDFGGAFEKIVIEKDPFPSLAFKIPDKVDSSQNSKKTTAATQTLATEQKGTALDPKKDVVLEKPAVESKSTEEKIKKGKKDTKEENKKATKDPAEKDADLSVIALNIQVGVIRKAWKHPSADSLLVEEIDLGDGNIRQVVSGLAKYCSPDDLSNRRVVLITNVKPGKLRDVMSSGLVLCASNQDHSIVEPLLPPEGAAPGERISFLGYEGKPEDVLNPKKKQLEKITPDLYTDDSGIATYKGIPFMTSAGPCTSSIPKAGIK